MGLGLDGASDEVTHINGPHGTVHRLIQSHQDVTFDIAPGRGRFHVFGMRKTSEPATPSAHRTEKLLKEIAEAGAAEMEFEILAALPPAAKRLPATEIFPARWRTKFSAGFPVRAELVIFLPLFRIAQDLVGLVDLLEFLL